MQQQPSTILDEAKELYEAKEEDYGESWRLTGEILAGILQQQGKDELVIPAEPEYLSALGLYTRRLDKMVRSFNGTFLKDGMEVDEDLAETVEDQVPYAAMHTTLTQELQQSEDENEKQTKEDRPPSPSEYCPQCGKMSTESVKYQLGDGREFYCTCGHVWDSSTH